MENQTIIEILLERNADPNLKDMDAVGGNTPLHLATMANMRESVAKMHGIGGDVEITNDNGFNCLHIAAREGFTDLVKFFKDKGTNLEARDGYGYSASYWAHRHKHADIVALLPPPLKVTKEEFYDHIVNHVHPAHPDVKAGGKKKKGKKKKKKK